MSYSRQILILAVALAVSLPLTAQVRIEATDTFPEPFSRIVGLRELADGRVIIADRLEQHVSYIDWSTGSITQISREGEGPGEYRQPIGLLPYPNEATLLTDLGNMRLSLIDRNGTIDESWPMMKQGEDGAMSFIRPTGADTTGAIYYSGGIVLRPQGNDQSEPDSTPIVRLNLASGLADTVASLFAEPAVAGGARTVRMERGGARTLNMRGGMLRPFPATDAWAVARDGRVAVVRASEYRVDWYNVDGTMHVGDATPYHPVRVGRDEKDQWAEGQSRNAVAVAMDGGGRGGGGGGSFQMPRPNIDEVEFPEVMPPFSRNAVSVTPNGDVWVQLNQPAAANQPVFDVFDSAGRKTRQVQLPPNRQLVGFGQVVIYAVFVDEDDLQWLEKYSYP